MILCKSQLTFYLVWCYKEVDSVVLQLLELWENVGEEEILYEIVNGGLVVVHVGIVDDGINLRNSSNNVLQ